MNMHNTNILEELALSSVRGRKPTSIDWSLADADGNTVLHLLFSIDEPDHARRRYGKPVQTFARALTLPTPHHQQLLNQLDLVTENSKGQSVIQLIAEHCLRPRSVRDKVGYNFWAMNPETGEMPPEKFPDTRNTAEQLYSTWIRQRLPLARSATLALCKCSPLSGAS